VGQIQYDQIVSDPDIMMGKPTIRGTRITVELILEKLGQGMSINGVLEAYPHLTKAWVLAALQFAADYLPAPFGPERRRSCADPEPSLLDDPQPLVQRLTLQHRQRGRQGIEQPPLVLPREPEHDDPGR
jgi:uncharacterized protein (DUF433 family)